MNEQLDTRRRRALYRAIHRGTKEMDWLLGRFAEARLAEMNEQTLAAFEDMLTLPDPQLQGWILDPSKAPAAVSSGLLEDLRAFHKLSGRGK